MTKLNPQLLELSEFISAELAFEEQLHIYRQSDSGCRVDAYAYLRKGARYVVCLLPSAQPNAAVKPIFHRWSWAYHLPDCHVISLSDPALYHADISAAWFLNSTEEDYITTMARFVDAIISRIGVPATGVLFYGSSMGGFGALMMASHFDGAVAVAEVPQLNLNHYPVKGAISNIEAMLLGGETLEAFSARHPERVIVANRFMQNRCVPAFRIVTNAADSAFKEHLEFLLDVSGLRHETDRFGDVGISVSSQSIGHKPLPTGEGILLIKSMIAGGWSVRAISDEERLAMSKLSCKELIDEATTLASSLKYVRTDEEKKIYDRLKAILYRAAEVNKEADWPLLKICSTTKLWTNSFNAEILQAALSAFGRRQSLEAFIYACRGILYGYPHAKAAEELDALIAQTESPEIANVGNIFKAIVAYDGGNYAGYSALIDKFLTQKSGSFDPYIAIPVSTVYTREVFAPSSFSPADVQISSTPLRLADVATEGMKYVISASCDVNYFHEYAQYLVGSFSRTCADEAILHLSVVNGDEPTMRKAVDEWGGKNVYVVSQGIEGGDNSGPIASLLRFCHVFQLMESYDLPVVVLDLDTVIKGRLSEFVASISDSDIGSRMLRGVAPWEAYTGGFAVFNVTPAAKYVAKNIAFVASELCEVKDKQWWIDQNCFEAGIRSALVSGLKLVVKDVYSIRDRYCVMPVGSAYAKKSVLDTALGNVLK